MTSGRRASIWVDVEDFAVYFASSPRPSGIQRVMFEIMGALMAEPPGVRFVRRNGPGCLREVGWKQVQALFAGVVQPTAHVNRVGSGSVIRRALRTLPRPVQEPLVRAGRLQLEAVGSLRQFLRRNARSGQPEKGAETVEMVEGDWLLSLGAPWAVPGFAEVLTALKARTGVRVALLLYDLVPARHPEWCTPGLVAAFDTWLDRTLPLCDRLMAISDHTAQDVAAYARERRIGLAGAPVTIPMGTGFGSATHLPGDGPGGEGLPAPGSYVLVVSTLEARKNHAFAVRVWRRLMEDVRTGVRPAASVPTLVFAGRVGWLVSDMLEQLDNTRWLQGKVRLIRDPTDAELRALYAGCLFTFVPSLFEGWGLPVTESLAAGVPCLISDRAALPEAGGKLARYFDPEDVSGGYRAVATLVDDRAALAAWREEVAQTFQPVPWSAAGRAVLSELAGA